MKTLLIGLACLFTAVSALADHQLRYRTSYRSWDHSFSRHYSYRETVSVTCGAFTCYEDYTPSSHVYVEESIVTTGPYAGSTRVTVYRDRSYSNRYVTYHTRNRRVIRRRFHTNHTRIRTDYRYANYSNDSELNAVVDEINSAIVKFAVGSELVELGAHVAIACNPRSENYEWCLGLSFASSLSGSLLSVSAYEDLKEASELYNEISKNEKESDEKDLDESEEEILD